MQRTASFAVGEYYHLYNRGVEKRDVYLEDEDYLRFQKMLYLCNSNKAVVFKTIQGLPLESVERGEQMVAIGAYALMPNHFHILAKEIVEGGISQFMEKLMTGYSMFFNKKRARVGPLFQGTYRAEHADRDEYLKYLFSYIHLNPLNLLDPAWRDQGISDLKKAKLYLLRYPWSSYPDYLGNVREEKLLLNPEAFPEYFHDQFNFEDSITDWLNYNNNPRVTLG